MKQRILFILFSLFLLGLMSLEKSDKVDAVHPPYQVSFGVKIGLLPTGKITQYAVIFYKNGQEIRRQPIHLNKLIKICSGEYPLPRSNSFVDLFEENGLQNDTLSDGTIVDFAAAFDSLWKVRFEAHPYDHQLGEGWSQGEIRPSLKQQAYIYDRYGVRGYDQEYFKDSSFFQLLKDVVDPEWIANYRVLR